MTEIPDKLYYIIGALIITNIGGIGTAIWAALSLSWKMSERFTKIEMKSDAVNTKADLAHGRIDKLENKVWK